MREPPKVKRVDRGADVPKNWTRDVLVLWQEDDARPPDAESVDSAFERIAGFSPHERPHCLVAETDLGDAGEKLFRDGWVYGWSCDGGYVGVLVERRKKRGRSDEVERAARLEEAERLLVKLLDPSRVKKWYAPAARTSRYTLGASVEEYEDLVRWQEAAGKVKRKS